MMPVIPWRRILLVFASVQTLIVRPAVAIPVPVPSFEQSTRIRVRLAEALPRVTLRGYDLKIFQATPLLAKRSKDLSAKRFPAATADRLSEWSFTCAHGKVFATSLGSTRGPGRVPARAIELREPVTIESPSGFLSVGNRPYRESVHLRSVGTSCEVVNEVDLEKYLDGLVNAEFSAKWPEEAVAAQVIAARTYALFQMRQARLDLTSSFDVDASTKDQVYDGSFREDYRASRVVEKTRGFVLVPATGRAAEPIKAFYHSTCGGSTELPQHVWGRAYPGFRRSVRCAFCNQSPRFRWEAALTDQDVRQAVLQGGAKEGKRLGWPSGWQKSIRSARLWSLRVLGYDPESRAVSVEMQWKPTSRPKAATAEVMRLSVPAARFRDWLGATRVRSTAFTVSADPGRGWKFEGRGNGHGVGLCQWGAKVMGERGYLATAILRHYYPDATLRKMW